VVAILTESHFHFRIRISLQKLQM